MPEARRLAAERAWAGATARQSTEAKAKSEIRRCVAVGRGRYIKNVSSKEDGVESLSVLPGTPQHSETKPGYFERNLVAVSGDGVNLELFGNTSV